MNDLNQTKSRDSEKDICQLIEEETDRRCCRFHEHFPGCEQCEVKPITFRRMVPAIISFFGLTILLVYGMVDIFPKYYS